MSRWSGKVAVVTGSSAGIGAEISRVLVNNGMKVVGIARRRERLDVLAAELGDSFHPVVADVTKERDVEDAFKHIYNHLGGVDVLVNSAGIVGNSSLIEGKLDEWRSVFDTNVLGLCLTTRAALGSMKSRNVAGHVIHINSVLGHRVPTFVGPHFSVYPASKHAVTALQESLRQELLHVGSKIKVTSLSPGLVATEISEASNHDQLSGLFEKIEPLKPIDVANAVVYILNTPPNVLVSELTIRPLDEP